MFDSNNQKHVMLINEIANFRLSTNDNGKSIDSFFNLINNKSSEILTTAMEHIAKKIERLKAIPQYDTKVETMLSLRKMEIKLNMINDELHLFKPASPKK